MHDQDKAILKSLVTVAWADGRVAQEETEVIEALLQAFGASDDEANDLRRYAQEPRTLDDIPITDLSAEDRRVLVQHAVLLTLIDGHQAKEEKDLLIELCKRLRIPAEEASKLIVEAEGRARRFANLL